MRDGARHGLAHCLLRPWNYGIYNWISQLDNLAKVGKKLPVQEEVAELLEMSLVGGGYRVTQTLFTSWGQSNGGSSTVLHRLLLRIGTTNKDNRLHEQRSSAQFLTPSMSQPFWLLAPLQNS